MLGFITQYFRGQTLYLRKHRVNAKTKAFIWTADKDNAVRMSTKKGVELMKIMKGFCSPAMVDRRGCVITTGGAPKTREQLNAELRWLREARSRARCYGRSLHYFERWQKRQAKLNRPVEQPEPKVQVLTLKPRARLDFQALQAKIDNRVQRLVLRARSR